MEIRDIVNLILEKTIKREIPWKKEEVEFKGTNYYQFCFNLEGVNFTLYCKNNKSIFSAYCYRMDSLVFKEELSGDFYLFISDWWKEEVVPRILLTYLTPKLQEVHQDPLYRLGEEEAAAAAVPAPLLQVVELDEEWVWPEPAPGDLQ